MGIPGPISDGCSGWCNYSDLRIFKLWRRDDWRLWMDGWIIEISHLDSVLISLLVNLRFFTDGVPRIDSISWAEEAFFQPPPKKGSTSYHAIQSTCPDHKMEWVQSWNRVQSNLSQSCWLESAMNLSRIMDLSWIWSDFCFPKDKLLGSIGNIAIALVNENVKRWKV